MGLRGYSVPGLRGVPGVVEELFREVSLNSLQMFFSRILGLFCLDLSILTLEMKSFACK